MATCDIVGTEESYTFYDEAGTYDDCDRVYYLNSKIGYIAPGSLVRMEPGWTTIPTPSLSDNIGVVTSSTATSATYSAYGATSVNDWRLMQMNRAGARMQMELSAQRQREVTRQITTQWMIPYTEYDPRAMQQLQTRLDETYQQVIDNMNNSIMRGVEGGGAIRMEQPRRESHQEWLAELERREDEIMEQGRLRMREQSLLQRGPLSPNQQLEYEDRIHNDLRRLREQATVQRARQARMQHDPFMNASWISNAEWYGNQGYSEYMAMQKKKDDAEARAQELLGSLIGDNDLKLYQETGHLFVQGKKYKYIIPRGDGFIKKIGYGLVQDMCVHLKRKSSLPKTDNVIALKMFLENDEKGALAMANIHNTWGEEEAVLPACAGMN